MSERETTPDITTELDALTKEVQQDREAGVFLHKSTAGYQHHVFCNASRSEPLGSSGCICTVVYKQDLRELEEKANRLDHLEAENARLNEQHKADNAMIRRVSERIEAELTAATSRAEQAERERDEAVGLIRDHYTGPQTHEEWHECVANFLDRVDYREQPVPKPLEKEGD